jgi:hypothetical protein
MPPLVIPRLIVLPQVMPPVPRVPEGPCRHRRPVQRDGACTIRRGGVRDERGQPGGDSESGHGGHDEQSDEAATAEPSGKLMTGHT